MSAALSGPNAAVYAAAYESMHIYFQRVNEQGGVNGRRVELLVEDDSGDATRAAANATKLVQQERVPLLLLASPSASYGPVISISKAASTPLLIVGACPRETLPPADPLLFCTASYGTTYDSAAAVRFIHSVAGSDVKLGLIGMDIPISRAYVAAGEENAVQAGMQVVTRQILPLTVTDFSSFATQVAQSGAHWAWAGAPWGAALGPFESLQKLGWTGNYLLWAHQPAEEDFRRRKVDNLYGLAANALFVEDLPIHREIRATADKYGTTYPVEQLAEGWVTAMALEEAVRTAVEPLGPPEFQAALNTLDLDTRGLRGGRLTFTPENHFRTQIHYRVYRWDSQQGRIVTVRDWQPIDVTP
jgi:ABC-type branched-subunit amino acid transport system substrate-binding protein